MKNRLLVFAIICSILFAFGADQAPPEFRSESHRGEIVTGKLLTNPLRVKADFGFQEIDPKFVRKITFSPEGDDSKAIKVELNDKSHLKGELQIEKLEFATETGNVLLSISTLREIKSTSKEFGSIWSMLLGLLTLSAMEIVLGIDNIIFLAIVAGKLPPEQQPKARRIGLIAALGTRLLLLASLSFLLGLTKPVFTLPDLPMIHDLEAREVSIRDLILIAGGIFLIAKSVHEMHEKLEAAKEAEQGIKKSATASFGMVLIQIAILDIIFSLDSVITAVGMVEELWVMITAMVIAMLVMMAFAGTISNFVAKHPTLKVLALAFLILIGVLLIAESLGQHIDKGYIYFAMAFAVIIEMINLKLHKKQSFEGV